MMVSTPHASARGVLFKENTLERTPLDSIVLIGAGFCANAGRVEFDPSPNSGEGTMHPNGLFWSQPTFSGGWPIYPDTPASRNVDPIIKAADFFGGPGKGDHGIREGEV